MERKVLGEWAKKEGEESRKVELGGSAFDVTRCEVLHLIPQPEDALSSMEPLPTVVFYGPRGTYTAPVEPYVKVLKTTFGLEVAPSPSA